MDISQSHIMDTVRILLVEDEAQIAQLYQRVLNQAGMMVKVATSGQIALDILKQEVYDIAFIDVMLPDLSGIEVLKAIRSNKINQGMAVIMLTNIDQESIIQQGFSMGAQGYLIKAQLAPHELVDIVKSNIKPKGQAPAEVVQTTTNQTKKGNLISKLSSIFSGKS